MPTLKINSMLPSNEQFTVRIDGVPCKGDCVPVQKSFHIQIEQFRGSASNVYMKKHFISLISVFITGGRYSAGAELASPYRAVWNADCDLIGDGEITIWLRDQGQDVHFEIQGKNITFTNLLSETTVTRAEKLRWFLGMLPFLMLISVPFLLLPYLMLAVEFSSGDDFPKAVEYIIEGIFIFLPLSALIYVWGSFIRKITLNAKGIGKDISVSRHNKIKFLTALQIMTLILFSATAFCEAIALFVFHCGEFVFATFLATVVLIIHLIITTNMLETLERTGVVPKEVYRKIEKIKKLKTAVLLAYAAIFAVMIIFYLCWAHRLKHL